MRFLVSGTTRSMNRLAARWGGWLGHLMTPIHANDPARLLVTGLPWAMDNGAFSGFDAVKFRQLLSRVKGLPGCLFVACPDVVADAKATLAMFDLWRDETAAAGHPVALVGQDGVENLEIPWDRFGAWFVGGSTDFKLSRASADLVQEARKRGKYVHMGRVNSLKRIEAAHDWGCHSVDGSSAAMYGDIKIPWYCSYLARLDRQGGLFPRTVEGGMPR